MGSPKKGKAIQSVAPKTPHPAGLCALMKIMGPHFKGAVGQSSQACRFYVDHVVLIWRVAGRAFQTYVERRNRNREEIPRRILADFFIGAHSRRNFESFSLEIRTAVLRQ